MLTLSVLYVRLQCVAQYYTRSISTVLLFWLISYIVVKQMFIMLFSNFVSKGRYEIDLLNRMFSIQIFVAPPRFLPFHVCPRPFVPLRVCPRPIPPLCPIVSASAPSVLVPPLCLFMSALTPPRFASSCLILPCPSVPSPVSTLAPSPSYPLSPPLTPLHPYAPDGASPRGVGGGPAPGGAGRRLCVYPHPLPSLPPLRPSPHCAPLRPRWCLT